MSKQTLRDSRIAESLNFVSPGLKQDVESLADEMRRYRVALECIAGQPPQHSANKSLVSVMRHIARAALKGAE